ncbi:NAD(+) diphosphatase [Gordonia desulfuricans]|uniref:NAD(+) diphosphatase n=1 Tax=Gordonia desulfuricans TaxID=89051 RepID=A0A7K3LPQ1_9ACTN|nr:MULTISPECIES: NAD(+) diphosphatase [Gordonia]EMP14536.2 NADH pyrophosphatase [Gordonia sp. NB41Y]NDK89507.1 NAD(+) diphosphatase [Gordonia desulfuricans]WLP89876.1 NAD(+) diphosphatase [Gordonia sp. NB41Y]
MGSFVFDQPPLLSRASYDRADEIRDDPGRMVSGWSTARVLDIDGAGRYPINEDGSLAWAPATDIADAPPEDAVFLAHIDTDLWTRRVDEVTGRSADARRGATRLTPDEAGLLATALGILNWHATSRFSPVDGGPTRPARGGWVRRHIDTGRDEFPRTDPAIITVVHDGGDRILLGRQATWPERWYSTLAGFVEPGESLEQCVIREVHEEVGITVREPRYLGSQPWPFPRSLMLGFAALADPDEPLQFLDGEIGDALWFHRDEVREALAGGDEWVRGDVTNGDVPGDSGRRLLLPGSISIARSLITAWANG